MAKTASTPTHIKARLGMHKVADMDVVKALTAGYNGVLNNPSYPNPPFDLATYKAGIDKYSALVVDAEDGGKKAISAKDKQRAIVIKMYTQLGHYVEAACNDDMAVFNTSGFTAVAKPVKTPPVPLTEAAFSSLDRGPNSGDVVVEPGKQAGAIAFDVRYALQGAGGALGPWTTVTITKPRKVTISGLAMAGIYQFPDPCAWRAGVYRLDGYENVRRGLKHGDVNCSPQEAQSSCASCGSFFRNRVRMLRDFEPTAPSVRISGIFDAHGHPALTKAGTGARPVKNGQNRDRCYASLRTGMLDLLQHLGVAA